MLVSIATAQGVDVRGVVTDSSNGQRIPFANISIRDTRLGVSTNLNGFFLITNVPPGKYVMVASAIGYAHMGRTVEIRGREPITVNFILSPQAVEVSEVITEGTQSPEKATATSMHVFGSKDIQDIPVAGQQDVLRAIQILPGIVSNSDVSAKFFVRGGAGDQNLILLDGMKMYNPFHAFGIFSVFDPDIISTAEVFTGAFPAGYGNRLSSVINLTTKAGNTTRFSGKGELNFLNAKVQLEGPINEDNSWLVNYRTSLSSNVFKHFLRTSVPVSFYDVFFKGTLGGATGRNSLRAFFSGDKITSDRPDEPDYSWDNYSIAGSLSGLAYDRVYVDAFAYSSNFRVKRDPKHSTIILPAESRVGDDGLRVEFTVHTESQNVWLAGFQFDLPEYEFTYATASNSNRTFRGTDPELWLWGRYQLHFGPLQTDFGIHSDVLTVLDNGLSLQGFQPRVSLVYQLSNAWRTKFGAGVYNQRVITISNEDDITSLFDAWISIPKGLKFEEAHHYVFGVEGVIVPKLSVELQSYYKNYPSLVLYNRAKFLPADPDYVNGKGKAYGGEALLRFDSPFADLYCAYSIGWTNVTSNGLTYSPRYDRRHTINALGVFHLFEDVDVSLRWEFGSGYPYTQTVGYYDRLSLGGIGGTEPLHAENGIPYSLLGDKNAARLPSYYRIDGSVTYKFMVSKLRGSLGISVANMTNRKNILFYDRKTGQQINSLDFFPSATLKVEY